MSARASAAALKLAAQQELRVLRQLEQELRRTIANQMKLPPYARARSTDHWKKALDQLDEWREQGKITGPGTEPSDPNDNNFFTQPTARKATMAKLVITPEIEAHTSKAVAAALKAEQKRVADALKTVELPEGTTARASAAIMKAVKAAIAPAK